MEFNKEETPMRPCSECFEENFGRSLYLGEYVLSFTTTKNMEQKIQRIYLCKRHAGILLEEIAFGLRFIGEPKRKEI